MHYNRDPEDEVSVAEDGGIIAAVVLSWSFSGVVLSDAFVDHGMLVPSPS